MERIPYSSVTGSLIYLMVCIRSDLAHCSSLVSRYMRSPGKAHWEATKWILRYLVGTQRKGLLYKHPDTTSLNITSYSNSDFTSDMDK